MVSWTREQEEAIYTDGKDVLVAAAAGSGKTAVLVERIIQKLLRRDHPVEIDSLLVVTFTNAAAQEMRNRVGEALESALAENPASMHLKKQLSMLQTASISTLHSFCLDVIRQYAYLLDIDPAFRIADDMEADLLKQEVLDDLFEEWYGSETEQQESFFQVVDRFSNDRSDVQVEDLILKLYEFAMQNPYPDEWLDSLAETYSIPDDWREEELDWLNIMKREVRNTFEAIQDEMELAMEMTRENDGPYQYAEAIESDLELLQGALSRLDNWDALGDFISQADFKTLSRKKTECNEDKKERTKKLRNSYKKRWNGMKDNWFTRDLNSHVEDMREIAPIIRRLTELVKQFKAGFTEQKRERALVDFSDLEHLCLELLIDNEASTTNHPVPSTVAKEYQRRFSEVLVDEYQDTNLVQETILTLISDRNGPGNMFMVGDVKQSIYRFRHAEPSLFIDKYKRFAGSGHPAARIDLASNFRSREQVLSGTNFIFRQILDEEVGEISYDADAELIYGNKSYDELPFPSPSPELVIIDREAEEESSDEEGEDFQDLEKAQLEARAYTEKIKEWIGQKEGGPLQVFDKETGAQRDFQYRDAVILLRSMTWAPTIADELKKQGIPVYAELSTGYFEAIEVKVMISFLKVIDNPRQDIPLASVLKSPIVGLNEEELAQIRLADKYNSFYDALREYRRQHTGKTADTVEKFLGRLEDFRLQARQGALAELIWDIYRVTGYFDFVGGMPGGRQRQANLRALYDRARGYEATSFRGLFRFLRFIERMEERGDDLGAARALSEQEDVVRIMTIHKSKGLEFPAVIVGAMGKEFNMQDLNHKYLLHKDLGFASKYIDPVKRITYPTLFYHALRNEKKRELLAEEMRVLYVALTRAKEKLVMVGNVPSFEKRREDWEKMLDHADWVMPAHYRMASKTYLDWVGPALIRHQNSSELRTEEIHDAVLDDIQVDPSSWKVSIVHGSEFANQKDRSEEEAKELIGHLIDWKPVEAESEELHQMVEERLSYQYPYQEAARYRAKQTVTEVKRQREIADEYSSTQLVEEYRPPIIKRPNFMQKEEKLTSAEKGTAMHTVMQHLPMDRTLSAREVQEHAERLADKEIMTREEADAVDAHAIEEFYLSDIAAYIRAQASDFQREVPFSLTLPANEVYANWQSGSDETVLLQGVIDGLIPKEDGWIILDYKTDAIWEEVTDAVKERLINRYRTQMELYRYAIEHIWKQPVKETYLYFFDKALLVRVP
ncbi:helicase-exonuclease AddAB subunit AddA [Virgibacillus sediminis]|uniref:ATP-dependent helicase/nuclease subunit A n=1 Tax=Virgibacillus sediminis TaxID=202260 RepID=A0ABV7AA91_9BACI